MGWYAAKTGNHQGLIIDENTGKNIAVTYDKEDAEFIASAPDLLTAAKAVIWKLNHNGDPNHNPGPVKISRLDATIRDLEAAIAKAEGR